jgi:hypothetical protein
MNPLILEIPSLEKSPEDVYILHACFTKTPNLNQFSQRVVSIYLQNLNGSNSEKYSIEKYASKNNIEIEDIEDWYDDLEVYVLDDFNSFLKGKIGSTFIYWHDDNKELILDIIKERFEELNKENTGKSFQTVPVTHRKSIQYLMKKVSEVEIPSDLKQFIKNHNNGQVIAGYLNNGEESNCFDRKEFNLIGTSIISKVSFFAKLINEHAKQNQKTLVVFAPIDFQSMKVGDIIRNLNLKSWLILAGLVGASLSLGYGVSNYLNSSEIKSLKDDNSDMEKVIKNKQDELTSKTQLFTDSVTTLTDKVLSADKALGLTKDSLEAVRVELRKATKK